MKKKAVKFLEMGNWKVNRK